MQGASRNVQETLEALVPRKPADADIGPLTRLLPRVLDGALALVGARLGDICLLDPATGDLRMVTYAGFDADLVGHAYAVDDRSARGRAVRRQRQVVVLGDTSTKELHGFQSTPIFGRDGEVVGVLSTQHRGPHVPPADDLRILEVYAAVVGEELVRPLTWRPPTLSSAARPSGPVVARQWIPSRQGWDRGDTPAEQVVDLAPSGPLGELVDHLVTRLFGVGLQLDSVRGMLGDTPATDRLAAASRDIDSLIRRVRKLLTDEAVTADRPRD